MTNYEEARVKLTNSQLNKLKFAAKSKTVIALRITKKKFRDKQLLHELFLTTNQKTKIRNPFANNMSKDIKLDKAQLSKIIQSVGFLGKTLGNMIGNLGTNAVIDIAVPLTKDVLLKLATKTTLSILDKFERKISGQGATRAEKVFTLFILNEYMDDIITIVESLEKSGLLTDGETEIVKH